MTRYYQRVIPLHPATDLAWMDDRAACRGVTTSEFFPDRGALLEQRLAPRALCERCPLQERCLDHALDYPERYGIWGGTNEKERTRLRRQRRQAG